MIFTTLAYYCLSFCGSEWLGILICLIVVCFSCLGHPSQSSEVTLQIRIVSNSHPIFDKYYYSVDVKESSPAGMAIMSLKAISPNNQKLIYSITDGDPYKEFTVDFNIGKQTTFFFHLKCKKAIIILWEHCESWGIQFLLAVVVTEH